MNWVADFLQQNPEYNSVPVQRRARRGIHFDVGGGQRIGFFTGNPCHYLDGRDWKPLDTALKRIGADWGAPGIPVRISEDGLIIVGNYGQQTTRVGVFNADTKTFAAVHDLPLGKVDGDSIVRETALYEHRLRLTENGLRETLTLKGKPNLGDTANRWLVLETYLQGVQLAGGWQDEFEMEGYKFPIPSASDADGNEAPAKRYAQRSDWIQRLFTGIPLEWLDKAKFPVVIDPDFVGDTGDGYITGTNADYAIARAWATAVDTAAAALHIGQYAPSWKRCARGFVKFDLSSIPGGSTIDQANLKLTPKTDYSDTEFDVQVVKQDWSVQDPLAAGNMDAAYDACLAGTLDVVFANSAALVAGTPATSPNMDTSYVTPGGNQYYSLRSSRDYNANEPAGNEYWEFGSANHGVAVYRPVLIVAYTEAAGGAFGMLLRGVGR